MSGALLAVTGPHSALLATPQIRYLSILPFLILLGGAVVLLAVASLVRRPLRVTVATVGTIAVSGAALGTAIWQWADVTSRGPYTSIAHAVVVDGFSALIAILVSCAMLLTALVGDGYLRREGVDGCEFHVLAMISASGAILMAEANDLIIVFLGLEILSIALYVLAASNHRRTASGEAGLKYFILGSFSSAIFVYGIALVYGATGSTNLTQMADFLSHNVVVTDGLLLAGLTLLLVGFAFKIAAVPFHMWTPDVYQGSPSPVTGFMAAVAKAGAFAALLRVFISSFGVLRADWRPVIYVLAIVTLLLGAGLAVVQRDVKRMLAYSSINHAGFILLGLQAATVKGVSSSLYYLFAYMFMVIGSFAVVTVIGRRGDRHHDLSTYRGLGRRQPMLALAFAILLFAQAGAPFTTGLWAKLQVVQASVNAGSVPLAVIAMVSAAVAAFFYLRVGVLMYTPRRPADVTPGVEPAAEEPDPLMAGDVGPSERTGHLGPQPLPDPPWARPGVPLYEGTERSLAVVERYNADLLIDAEPLAVEASNGHPNGSAAAEAPSAEDEATEDEAVEAEPAADGERRVAVPVLSAVAIGLCTAVTVVFGIIPAPLIDFAHQATLFFF